MVIAKAPLPGRSKTRLCPPLDRIEAAKLAAAALGDTLAAVAATPARRRVLALDGPPGEWLPAGFDLVPQRGEGLAERLASAFEDCGGPALLIGMDTPQLTPAILGGAIARLETTGVDAVLGPALDGGYWAIGLRLPDRRAFEGVPMSAPWTCAVQRARLQSLGARVAELPELRDVDTFADALAVAAECPRSAFASVLSEIAGERQAAHPTGLAAG